MHFSAVILRDGMRESSAECHVLPRASLILIRSAAKVARTPRALSLNVRREFANTKALYLGTNLTHVHFVLAA